VTEIVPPYFQFQEELPSSSGATPVSDVVSCEGNVTQLVHMGRLEAFDFRRC